jgi:probable F420-dependent oxidoreductase
MRVGVHLPQYGRVAGPEAITRAARHAEELGFADVWVSDHIVHPAGQGYPSPYLFDPLVTLTWAGAVTTRIGLGTSVLVVPTHHPLELANTLASLDRLTGGRVTVGVGAGWSEAEYAALGYDFHDRGRRLSEAIDLLRAAWRDDPVTFHGEFTDVTDLRVLPRPSRPLAIWVGGTSDAAIHRAVAQGDGYQLIGVTPAEARPIVARIRAARPEASFTVSLRTGWDPQGMAPAVITEERREYAEAGVDHVVAAPWRTDLDDWLRSMDLLAGLVVTPAASRR